MVFRHPGAAQGDAPKADRAPRPRPRRRTALLACATVVAVAAGVLGTGSVGPAPAASAAESAPGARVAGPAAASQQITLVTGDRVRLSRQGGRLAYEVLPAPGRGATAFREVRAPGADGTEHLSLVPADAAPLIAAGTVDERLFDLTLLLRSGYTDERTDVVPLLVSYDRPGLDRRAPAPGGTVTVRLESVNTAAVDQDKDTTAQLWQRLAGDGAASALDLGAGVSRLALNGRVEPLDDVSTPQVGAPTAWEAGFDGTGTTVAVLDTGLDESHPDIAGRVSATRDFTGSPNGVADLNGHGTHTTTTVAGDAAASDGRYPGVAPGARIAVGKVLGDDGYGTQAWVMAGMEWAAREADADVVSMSLGGYPSDGTDLESQLLDRLTEETGTLFVVAAGNNGAAETIGSPGSADEALTVGAVDSGDTLARFSSRGPRVFDGAIKPDITGPGVNITAGASSQVPGWPADTPYRKLSGTSMATPHVAGAAAIVKQMHPDWTAEQIKPFLTSTAEPGSHTVFEQGTGRVDLARGVAQPAFASPASISTRLPDTRTGPVTRTLTYHNDSDTALELTLSLTAENTGTHEPTDLFSLDRTSVTVPPHSTAPVTLTVDPAREGHGAYGGVVTATGGATRIVTAVGAARQPELMRVEFRLRDRAGQEVSYLSGSFDRPTDLATGQSYFMGIDEQEGTWYTLLPKGDYTFSGSATFPHPGAASTTAFLTEPRLTVDADTTVWLDEGEAVPVGFQVDRAEARDFQRTLYLRQEVAGRPRTSALFLTTPMTRPVTLAAVPTAPVTDRPFEVFFANAKIDPVADPTGSDPRGGAFAYQLSRLLGNQIPADATVRVRDRDLAQVVQRYHAPNAVASATQTDWSYLDQVTFPSSPLYVPPGGTSRYYYTTHPRLGWSSSVSYPSGASESYSLLHRTPGVSRLDWFGPATTAVADARRTGDTLSVSSAPFSGSAVGHRGSDRGTTSLTLSRDGQTVGKSTSSSARFTLPADTGTYQLAAHAQRDVTWTDLGTTVDTTWSFTSGPAAGTRVHPLYAVRADVDTDLTGRVNDRWTGIGVRIDPGAATGARITRVTAEVSFDDGATWRTVPVERHHVGWALGVRHPSGSGFVSLRIRAVDTDGASVEQTTVRGYAYR